MIDKEQLRKAAATVGCRYLGHWDGLYRFHKPFGDQFLSFGLLETDLPLISEWVTAGYTRPDKPMFGSWQSH